MSEFVANGTTLAVPESETCALMLMGLVGVALAARRRKQGLSAPSLCNNGRVMRPVFH